MLNRTILHFHIFQIYTVGMVLMTRGKVQRQYVTHLHIAIIDISLDIYFFFAEFQKANMIRVLVTSGIDCRVRVILS